MRISQGRGHELGSRFSRREIPRLPAISLSGILW